MTPYYQDKQVKIYHGDSLGYVEDLTRHLTEELEEGTEFEPPFDHLISDPPFDKTTHAGARSRKGKGAGEAEDKFIEFASITYPELKRALELFAPLVGGWVILNVDYRHAVRLEDDPPRGLKFMRMGIWVKPGSAPQFTGDRPGMGWEAIAFLHKDGVKSHWNGHGRSSVFTHAVARGDHPTQKPQPLLNEFVQLFTEEGDTVFDPFCGSGTTLRAAKDLLRNAVGVELNEEYCKRAAQRMRQEVLDFGKEV